MYQKENYINFQSIIIRVLELDQINMKIDIEKLKKNSIVKNERVREFIATNNIEGDIISFTQAKMFLRDEVSKTKLERRWMGIKRASEFIWNNIYQFNLDYIKEVHRALLKECEITGGIWKTKINQVGSLITTHSENVPKMMNDLFSIYSITKINNNVSLFSIIPMISEFLSIHPFEDGNGRMSRLIMNRELFDAGYKFVKYISLSKFLWKNKKKYISALEFRNRAWSSKTLTSNDLVPLFEVLLDAMIEGAKQALEISSLVKYSEQKFENKIIKNIYKPMQLNEIMQEYKIANSKNTISKWLNKLVKTKKLNKSGNLKGTKYSKKDKLN